MNANASLCMVLQDLPVLALLSRAVLALPLEKVGAEKAILIPVSLGKPTLVQGHEQEYVAPLDDESGLSPNCGLELEPEKARDLFARVTTLEL